MVGIECIIVQFPLQEHEPGGDGLFDKVTGNAVGKGQRFLPVCGRFGVRIGFVPVIGIAAHGHDIIGLPFFHDERSAAGWMGCEIVAVIFDGIGGYDCAIGQGECIMESGIGTVEMNLERMFIQYGKAGMFRLVRGIIAGRSFSSQFPELRQSADMIADDPEPGGTQAGIGEPEEGIHYMSGGDFSCTFVFVFEMRSIGKIEIGPQFTGVSFQVGGEGGHFPEHGGLQLISAGGITVLEQGVIKRTDDSLTCGVSSQCGVEGRDSAAEAHDHVALLLFLLIFIAGTEENAEKKKKRGEPAKFRNHPDTLNLFRKDFFSDS